MKIGPLYRNCGVYEFVVWAPFLHNIELKIVAPRQRTIPMSKDKWGYWRVVVDDVVPITRYLYELDKTVERPDPASHFQPQGVHGPSQVVDHSEFKWTDSNWSGLALEEMIIYELHVGTFTSAGTFKAIIPRLNYLQNLGINTIEIMPVAQFPGERNWGYDGVYPFSVQNSYGGPEGLKNLVDICHSRGVPVILDVVYNHLGPEGNYLRDFGPYFTDKYKTPWGEAVNFDDEFSDDVRIFFIENALHWFQHFHIDALRIDAIHTIYDFSAKPFLQELAEKVEEFSNHRGRKSYLIAESDLNNARVIRPRELGGYGIDAQWSDDFHHSVHTLLTGEESGYYVDFGKIEHLAKAVKEGYVYSWRYSKHRKRRHGTSSIDRPAHQFVVCTQNHDQVGNRMLGNRLSELVAFEALKLAAGTLLLSPYIPLIFMGEEYGEESPFLYFVSHGDPDLINAVREGRKAEFKQFQWKEKPPDPQSVETFLRSKIKWGLRNEGKHKVLFNLYQRLIQLRKEIPALANLDKKGIEVSGQEKGKILLVRRWYNESHIFYILNFNNANVDISISLPTGNWKKTIDSSEKKWSGQGTSLPETVEPEQRITIQSFGFALYRRETNQ